MNERKEALIGKKLKSEVLPINDLSTKLVEDLDKEYKSKTAKNYGHFDKVSELDTFQSLLKKYCSKKSDEGFIEFTKKSTELFISEISGTAATGGSLFFIDYNDSLKQNLFAVFVLNDKESCGLNKETLSLEESMSLDIEKLNMAVLIYLKRWLNNESDSYLSFAKRAERNY
jgi:nucleoid-associated protein YejK